MGLAAATALAIGHAACSGTQPVPSVPSDAEIRRLLVERIDSREFGVGIVVGVVEPSGRRVLGHGRLGPADSGEPYGDTVFEIGSITKAFTAVLLADMVTRGEVELDAPVQGLLGPEVRMPTRDGAQITPGHLAMHSSGLPRLPDNLSPEDPANPYADYDADRLHAFLSTHELSRDIGERVEYSNLGVGLLGYALARRMATDYESLLKERVLGPLGMSDTSISLTDSMRERLATGHGTALEPARNWDMLALAGAGGLRSTVNDMLTFVEANVGLAESPSTEAIALTHGPRREFPGTEMAIGLAWLIRKDHDREFVWHNGGTGGYRSFLGFVPESRTGVVVLANSSHSVDDLGFHLLDTRFELPKVSSRTEAEIDPAVFDEYVGRYQLARNVLVTVSREEERLFVQLTGQQRFEVFPESETRFFLRAVEAQVSFGRDDSGAVDHLVVHQNGADQRAVRLAEGVDSVDYGPSETVSLPEETLQRYVGRYELQSGFLITVTHADGQLYTQVTGQSKAEIYPSSETEFFYRVVDAKLTFQTDSGGAATSLVLRQAGREFACRKLPD